MTSPEEIKAEYASSLADLTFNSKPLINVLTMLAEENSPNAKVIVEAIETHLSKVATDVKLPILYLIDCIVKNVGGTYTTLFSQNIVSTFCGVFKAVDEKTRAEMFKLRQTWNDVFPQKKLYAIDVQINLLDPAWPVTAKPPPNNIHVNPRFLKKNTSAPETESAQIMSSSSVTGNIDKETLSMQEKLIQKQKELLELQQKKLELELLQTQVKLQEQIKHNAITPTASPSLPLRPQNILLKPEVAKQLVPAALTHKPAGINATSIMHQRLQANVNNGPRINPVSSALVAATRPIRDPRLLRQQQKSNNSSVQLSQKTAVLENNKNVTFKVGLRKTRKDPRLVNKEDIPAQKIDTTKPINPSKSRNSDTAQKISLSSRNSDTVQKIQKISLSRGSPKGSTDSNSTKSSSSSSLDSPSRSKSDKFPKSPTRHKKKEKSDEKKFSPTKDQKRDNSTKSDSPTTFKGVKSSTKNRNYVRRNLGTMSPEPPQDEDLRSFGPPEKQPRLQGDTSDEQSSNIVTTTKGMDVDLRQLPAVIGKKRLSTEAPDQSSFKKSKTEVFHKLFGDEDTDLRQLPITPDRPPTPPPPIISSSDNVIEKIESPKSNLDAVRAKLANATNRDKILSKSFNKKKMGLVEDQDLRVPKVSSTTDVPNKIIISPEDESCIKSGTLTKEQEQQLLNKIIMQMEINKLKEAKKKEHEESFNISLQPISDDELMDSDDEKKRKNAVVIEENPVNVIPNPPMMPPNNEISSVIPFNDKDERIRPAHLQQQVPDYIPPPFMTRDPRDLRRPPGPNWRGMRGRRWDNQPMGPQRPPMVRPWNQPPGWMKMPPNFLPQPREFGPMPPQTINDEEMPGSPDLAGDQLTNGAVNQDEIKTLNIDGVPKDIRFYEETAIAFISWDEPKEISFQDGVRHVVFNDKDSYTLVFNQPYQEVHINGLPHKVRLGAPSREIYIDQVPYECYFGSAGIRIELNGVVTTVKLEGPPPQVKIGETKRTDLVAGKINLFINAKIVVPVFLDAKVQKFNIDGETSTIKFVNALETVLINDIPFNVEYGGLPKPIIIHDKKHFIRFSVLPKGIRPGHVVIKDMESEGNFNLKIDENSQDSMPADDLHQPTLRVVGRVQSVRGTNSPDRNSNSPNFFQNMLLQQQNLNNLDVLSNVVAPSLGPIPTTEGYQIGNVVPAEDSKPINMPQSNTIPPALNINDLFQKLVASGFVTSGHDRKSPIAPLVKHTTPNTENETKKPPEPVSSNPALQAKPYKRNTIENLKTISFARPETLKVRQGALYTSLYSGMQCSSCGMRFSPEASILYSQHLDWHFRQNRKGKRNIRVAASRRWYYSLSDWKNYEELEDLEEREKNYFDQQQQQAEGAGDDNDEEVEVPSVPADPERSSECCEVCRDKFDQFFNEEKEEWHLKNAIRVDDKTYHPVCYEDYQQSLIDQTMDESKIEIADDDDKPEDLCIPGLEIIIDDDDDDENEPYEPPEVVSLESDESKTPAEQIGEESQELPLPEDEDDDDVILNEVAPIKIVVDDDEEENQEDGDNQIGNSVNVKQEKLDDGFVEVGGLVSLQNGGQIKIKAEPVDPDEQSRIPITRRESESEPCLLSGDSDMHPKHQDFPSHTEMVTSIDGNIDIVCSTPSAMPTGSMGNRIKINISKPLPVIQTKEKETSDSELPTETYIDPSEPFPPGEEPEPATLKPALEGIKLKKLQTVKKGSELSGLCSIM